MVSQVVVLMGLSLGMAIGILLTILASVLYDNWYPIFAIIAYVLAPWPNMICGRCGGDDVFSSGASAWRDVGYFLTGTILTSGLALPLVLAHARVIEVEAMVLSLISGVIVYGTILLYVHRFKKKSDSF